MLGDAFVVISPDTDGFRTKTIAQVKAALAGLKFTVPVGVDVNSGAAVAAIKRLQALMRQTGLADFLDIDVPTGKVIAQLQLLKRLMNSMGLTDLIGFSLSRAQLEAQLSKIAGVEAKIPVDFDTSKLAAEAAKISMLGAETIPVNFDVSKLPVLGPVGSISEKIPVSWDIPLLQPLADAAAAGVTEHIPVDFDVGKIPALGTGITSLSEKITVDTTGAQANLAALAALADSTRAAMGYLDTGLVQTSLDSISMARSVAGANNALAIMSGDAARSAAAIALGRQAIDGLALSGGKGVTVLNNMAAAQAIMNGSAMRFAAATVASTVAVSTGIPLWERGTGWLSQFGAGWAIATGKVNLFGGALKAMGIPLIASISLWHLAVESAFELTAAIIPAGVALAAFGALAVPTAQHIAIQFQNIWTASNALNTSIYPLTKSMQNLDAAVRPEVYQLFGQALVVATQDAGVFAKIAAQTGLVLDQLGARAAVALTSGGFGEVPGGRPARPGADRVHHREHHRDGREPAE